MTVAKQAPEANRISRRRRVIFSLLPLSVLAACKSVPSLESQQKPASVSPPKPRDPIANAAPLVRKDVTWRVGYYLEFIAALPPSGMLVLKKSLGLVPFDAKESALKGPQADMVEIASSLCQASSWLGYCRNPADFDYHGMVGKVADQAGVDQAKLKLASTFDAEHLLMEKVYADIEKNFVSQWDKMTPEQRKKVLARADPNGQLKDHAAIAAQTGSVAIRALTAVVALSGFSAYVAATTALSAAAAAVGLTLPIGAYTTMTATIAVVTGPIGWAAATVASIFAVAMALRPDTKKMAAFALTMHALKLDAVQAAEG